MVLYKYLEKRYLNQFRQVGRVHLGSLKSYRITEDKERRDPYEGLGIKKIAPDDSPIILDNIQNAHYFPNLVKNQGMTVMPKAHVTSTTDLDAYVFCTSEILSDRLMKKWNCDAYYKITDPMQFAKNLYEELSAHLPLKNYIVRKINYVDSKEKEITNENKEILLAHESVIDACFEKPKKFCDEKEVRILFITEPDVPIRKFYLVNCKKLLTYCSF